MIFGSILARSGPLTLRTSEGISARLSGSWLERAYLRLFGLPHLGARLRFRVIRRFLQGHRFRSSIDVGCGAGLMSFALGDICGRVLGLDLDAFRLDTARSLAETEGENAAFFARADARRLPCAGGRFDLVICSEVIEHVDDDHGLLAELRRVLAPGGVLLLTTTADEPWNRDEEDAFGHARPGYSRDLLQKLLDDADLHVDDICAYGISPLARFLWRAHRRFTALSPRGAAAVFPAVYPLAILSDMILRTPRPIGYLVKARLP